MKCDLNTYAAQLEYAPEVWKKFHISIPRNEWSRALIWKVSIDTHIRHCDGLHDRLHALGRTLDRGKKRTLERQHVASICARSFRKNHQARTTLEPLLKLTHVFPRHSTRAFNKFRPLKAGQNPHP